MCASIQECMYDSCKDLYIESVDNLAPKVALIRPEVHANAFTQVAGLMLKLK